MRNIKLNDHKVVAGHASKSLMKIVSLCVLSILILAFSSCKKEDSKPIGLASFTVVNAVGALSVKSDFTGKPDVFATTETQTDFGRRTRFVIPVNQPIPVTVVSSLDHSDILFQKSLTFSPGDIYSLFLVGELGAVETLLVKEDIPSAADKAMKIRFLNGSPTVGEFEIVPIRVDQSGVEMSGEKITGPNYKYLTEFAEYSAEGTIAFYKFELRESATGTLLQTLTVSPFPKGVSTLVLRGSIDGSPSFGGFTMPHNRP